MNQTVKISMLHVVFLSMTVIGLKNHVTILPPILQTAGRDGWIAVVVACLVMILWVYWISRLAKQAEQTEKLLYDNKKLISKVFRYVMVFMLLLLCATTMIEMLQWVNTTFLPRTPMIALFVAYFLLCMTLATTSLQTIVIVNTIVLFGVIVLGFFVAFVNIQMKDYSLLLPMLEHGWTPVTKAAVFPAAGFVELLLLYYIQRDVKQPITFRYGVMMLLILTGLTLGPLIAAVAEFGPEEAAKQRYPAYEEWGLAQIGRFIEHMDFFSVYQWMTGAFIRISFYLYVVIKIVGFEQNKQKAWVYISPIFAVICLILLLLDEQIFILFNNYVFLVVVWIVLFVIGLVCGGVVRLKRKERWSE